MKRTLYIVWCIAALAAIITYLFRGFTISFKPEALTWSEFSANPQAMEHFAERNGIVLDGSSEQLAQLHREFDADVTYSHNFASSEPRESTSERALAPRGWLGRVQHMMSSMYHMWLPRRDPPGRRVHHLFRFSVANEARWTIGLTLVTLIAVAAVCTTAINALDRKARA